MNPERAARRAGTLKWLGSARLGSARLGSARLGSARLGSARLGSARLGSARLGSARLGSARLGSARLGSARLGSARLGSARLGSARLGSARLGSARLGKHAAEPVPPCQAPGAGFRSLSPENKTRNTGWGLNPVRWPSPDLPRGNRGWRTGKRLACHDGTPVQWCCHSRLQRTRLRTREPFADATCCCDNMGFYELIYKMCVWVSGYMMSFP